MYRAAMAPHWAPHRTHTGAAGSLLLPQLLARARDFAPRLGLVRSGMLARLELPHRFVQEVLVDLRSEDFIAQRYFADLGVGKIHYIECGHGSLFALRTSP